MCHSRCGYAFMLTVATFASHVLLASAQGPQPEPTNIVDWAWWKLGLFEEWEGPGTTVFMPTSYGNVQAHTFGTRRPGQPVALAMHSGMNINHVHREWDRVAAALADDFNYFVVVPNFHSVRTTSPGKISNQQMMKLIPEILVWLGGKSFDMLLGKAWGGAMATRFSIAHPKMVRRLALVSPTPLRHDLEENPALSIPVSTMFLFCLDDSSMGYPLRKAIENMIVNRSHTYDWYKGGNTILSNFTTDILRFAKVTPVVVDSDEPEDTDAPEHFDL